ncbi:MAG TPA: MaoC/PaaZ C-terminal domain-containing protein [Bacteroidia bacterium]|nr:MaoC/PaaZ C-terminal domain-containing protein [Bacteroidia bacterium]
MFIQGTKYDFGIISFSEEEIISFAKLYDPLEFHINKEAAQKSIFKGFVASGPHAFHFFYINCWIPLFGKTVMAGLGISEWKFFKPIYPEQKVHCIVTITDVEEFPEKKSAAVNWEFEIKNEKEELFQYLNMKVLHRQLIIDN